VIARLSPTIASTATTRIAPSAARTRKRGALSHPAARGRTSGPRTTLPAAVASAIAGRLSLSAPKRAAKPRASLAAAVASAVAQRLSAGPRTLRR
jgi:hypothetical protein